MNVSFTNHQIKYIQEQVESGDFQNASEVVRDAIRLHSKMRNMLFNELKLEIEKGLDSGISDKSPQQILADKKNQYGIK